MEKELEAALDTLKRGGLILYPTDTVWGIGCDATDEKAVERIYELKRSENKHSMLVLCRDADMIVRYVDKAPGIAFEVMEMADKPLTLILDGAVGVAPNLIPEEGTLGVRVPDHEFCRQLLRRFGKPIVSTSANVSGEADEGPRGGEPRDNRRGRFRRQPPFSGASHMQTEFDHRFRTAGRSENNTQITDGDDDHYSHPAAILRYGLFRSREQRGTADVFRSG